MLPPDLWRPAPHRIAVFRALQLGDMLCVVPALRALRLACPDAHITLAGLESARPFVERFSRYIDDLIVFPGIPSFPEQKPQSRLLPGFFRAARDRHFDVALQMHGSGERSMEVVRKLQARRIAGFVPATDMPQPGRLMPWPGLLAEPLRYIALMKFLGVPVQDETLEMPLHNADRAEAWRTAQTYGFDPGTTIFVHPGAGLPSRRWPADRYAAVARALAAKGWRIAVTGTDAETRLTGTLTRQIGPAAVDLAGRTSLGTLAALLVRTPLLICNDTAVSHLAAALGTRSVVVSCGSDVERWAPLDSARHTVVADHPPCRPCAYESCPIGHPCALNVTVDQVLRQVSVQLKLHRDQPR